MATAMIVRFELNQQYGYNNLAFVPPKYLISSENIAILGCDRVRAMIQLGSSNVYLYVIYVVDLSEAKADIPPKYHILLKNIAIMSGNTVRIMI